MKKLLSLFIVIAMLFGVTGCSSESHEGEAKTPSASSVQKGRDYQQVLEQFEEKGFTNIKLETLDDLVTGLLTKDGEVESVSVDGNLGYSADTWYPADVEVIITYHTFPDKESENISESEVPDVSTSEGKPSDEILTIKNCPELAAMLGLKADIDPSYTEFAETYKKRIIEFDGCITYLTNHDTYDTRYDLLISAGDYVDENTANPGPIFKFEDVGIYDLGLSGLDLPDFVVLGSNIKIRAEVENFDSDSGIFELDPVLIEAR